MNELELQRIVDGECDRPLRTSILASLSKDSPHWRELALRLLEDQDLRKHFGSTQHCLPVVTITKEEPVETKRRAWSLGLFAASLLYLVTGSLAYYRSLHPSAKADSESLLTNNTNEPNTSSPVLISPHGAESTSPAPANLASLDPVPAGRVQWLTSKSSNDVLETPVFEVSRVAPEMFVSEEARRLSRANSRLNRQGWNANFDTQIYEGQMEDGRRMIVPVNVLRFEPLGY